MKLVQSAGMKRRGGGVAGGPSCTPAVSSLFPHSPCCFKLRVSTPRTRPTASETYGRWLCPSLVGSGQGWMRFDGSQIRSNVARQRSPMKNLGLVVCVCVYVVPWEVFIERTGGPGCRQPCHSFREVKQLLHSTGRSATISPPGGGLRHSVAGII